MQNANLAHLETHVKKTIGSTALTKAIRRSMTTKWEVDEYILLHLFKHWLPIMKFGKQGWNTLPTGRILSRLL